MSAAWDGEEIHAIYELCRRDDLVASEVRRGRGGVGLQSRGTDRVGEWRGSERGWR